MNLLGVLHELGLGIFFAAHPHTAKHFRKSLWMAPCYLNRSRLANVRLDDLPHLLSREVRRISSAHSPKPLPPDKAAEIVVYCANGPCRNSGLAARRLAEIGYTNVHDYDAGKADWIEAGLPVERGSAHQAA